VLVRWAAPTVAADPSCGLLLWLAQIRPHSQKEEEASGRLDVARIILSVTPPPPLADFCKRGENHRSVAPLSPSHLSPPHVSGVVPPRTRDKATARSSLGSF
jgi:hypothetical protein